MTNENPENWVDIWDIKEVVDIVLVSWEDVIENGQIVPKYYRVEPSRFKEIVLYPFKGGYGEIIKEGNNKAPEPKDDNDHALHAYYIHREKCDLLGFSSSKTAIKRIRDQDSIEWVGTRWDGMNVNFTGKKNKCTKFYKLFWRDLSYLYKQGYKRFYGDTTLPLEKNERAWLSSNDGGSYDGYLQILYRDIKSYISTYKCNTLAGYRNKNLRCKTYLDSTKLNYYNLIPEYCSNLKNNPEVFSDECDAVLRFEDKINYHEAITENRISYCLIEDRLITDNNCRDYKTNSKPDRITSEQKSKLDSYAINLCTPNMNTSDKTKLEFCSCIIEPRKEYKIIEKETGQELAPTCYNQNCSTSGYKLASYLDDKAGCPKNFCLQNTELSNLLEASNINITCNQSNNTSLSTNPPPISSTNILPIVTNPPPISSTNILPVVTNSPPISSTNILPVVTNPPPISSTNILPVITNPPPISSTNSSPILSANTLPVVTNSSPILSANTSPIITNLDSVLSANTFQNFTIMELILIIILIIFISYKIINFFKSKKFRKSRLRHKKNI